LYIKNVLQYLFLPKSLFVPKYYLFAYYLLPFSFLYRCTTTVFYKRIATLYRCTAANIVISKAGIHSPIFKIVLSSFLNTP